MPKNYHPPGNDKPDDLIDDIDELQQANALQNYGFPDSTDPFRSSSFLAQLKEMTKPEHNWILLHVMFWVYIALVFPGCYLLGKQWSDFRVVYAGLLGSVTVFSLLFSYVGQRGYGEASAVHSLVIAKSLPEGKLDVSSWLNVFVTNGADYEIRHNASGVLYSTCNDHEEVKGVINNGADAVFKVDIPPFSNREMAVRMKSSFTGPQLTVNSLQSLEGRLADLSIGIEGLAAPDIYQQYVLYGNTFYTLKWSEGHLVLDKDLGNVAAVLRVQDRRNNYFGFRYTGERKQTTEDRYAAMFELLLSRSLNVGRERDAEFCGCLAT